jgi:hypothetical protein
MPTEKFNLEADIMTLGVWALGKMKVEMVGDAF